jgi:hypothetical protein
MPASRVAEIKIDLQPLGSALSRPLDLIDSPERREAIERYLESATIYLERAALGVLSTLAAAMNEGGTGVSARVEHRPDGQWFVVDVECEEEIESDLNLDLSLGKMEKVTVRLPGELKELIDQMARLEGFSANNWYIRELARATARGAARGATQGMGEAFRQAFTGTQARRSRRGRTE